MGEWIEPNSKAEQKEAERERERIGDGYWLERQAKQWQWKSANISSSFYYGMLATNSVENFRLPLFFISQPTDIIWISISEYQIPANEDLKVEY